MHVLFQFFNSLKFIKVKHQCKNSQHIVVYEIIDPHFEVPEWKNSNRFLLTLYFPFQCNFAPLDHILKMLTPQGKPFSPRVPALQATFISEHYVYYAR